jgi:hypothetical protein
MSAVGAADGSPGRKPGDLNVKSFRAPKGRQKLRDRFYR